MRFSGLKKIVHQWMPRIIHHPFNQGLAKGTLPLHVFNTFLHQDKGYLKEYAEVLHSIANRLNETYPLHADKFYEFSKEARDTENHLHQKYLKRNHAFSFFKSEHLKQNPVIIAYAQHLHQASRTENIAIAIAAVLPCVIIYRELGITMPVTPQHRFHRWIATYSNPQFLKMGDEMADIFDEHSQASQHDQIEKSFVTSIEYEIKFWDSVYNKKHKFNITPTPQINRRVD